MKKNVKEFCVYNFDELNEESKQKAIEIVKEYEEENYCEYGLNENMNEKANELLKDYFNIESGKDCVYYDLSYCQGSGAMICFTINIKDLNNKYHIYNSEEMKLIQDKSLLDDIIIYHNDNLYYHEYTFDIRYGDNFGCYDYEDIKGDYKISEKEFNTMENKLIDLLDTYNKHYTKSQFIKDIINMNSDLKNYGYDEIEYFWKHENILNYCKEHTYYEDGTIYEW